MAELRKLLGFTLIELMIVVAIVALLAAIALPSYEKQVMKSHRTSAKTALMDLASREERYYSTNNAYTMELSNLGYANVTSNAIAVPSSSEDYYSVSVTANPASTATSAATYIATATPSGNQANDSCGNYTITDLGVQGNSGTPSGGTSCW